jgi:crotonobetainyl-CoA:carnitine CoA-transferase CaiB-like acyl-CoA transferase
MVAAGNAALEGRRVLEIADESGVYCGKLMADMGADVVKIERPGGDPTRLIPPFLAEPTEQPDDHTGSPAHDEPENERSLFFLGMNTSKRAITLDIRSAEGSDLFRRLAATAHIVIETLPPGTLDALGLGYEQLRKENPELVLTSITGFGQSGPHRDFRSTDLIAGAMGGAMAVTGEEADPPVTMAGEQNHLMASTCAAASSLIALFHAGRTGAGQHVDIAIQETTLAVTHISGVGKWLDDGIVPKRFGSALFASVPSGTYRCRDGLIYLMVNRPAHWKSLAEWIHEETGNEEVLLEMFEGPSSRRQEYRDLLDIFIADLTALHTVDEIFHEGQRRHIAFTPVNSTEEVAVDPQLVSRAYFAQLDRKGTGVLTHPGAPFRHTATPWQLSRPAPRVGEHNHEVYVDELGLSEEQLGALCETGVV